jgi:phage terminase large subunit-like protein
LVALLKATKREEQKALLERIGREIGPQALRAINACWRELWARAHQLPPRGDWTTWLLLGGRGAGKTRAGAEWVRALVLGRTLKRGEPVERIALVGETMADVRDVMVNGESGLARLDWGGDVRPRWVGARRTIELPNGAIAMGFSSEDPESLRGPQFSLAGATSWRSGSTPTRRGTCCSSGCGSATARARW